MSDFGVDYGIPYEERVRLWQLAEDAKEPRQLFRECQHRIADAVEDFVREARNAPHSTLEVELLRARYLFGLINHPERMDYRGLLKGLPPVSPPAPTMSDYTTDAALQVAKAVDSIVLGKVLSNI